ncbi:MAG: hypothetical protein KJ607_11130 [Bacteroidetes bacterium]|nr:hypothetical protein [Bacteroidota bacterium]
MFFFLFCGHITFGQGARSNGKPPVEGSFKVSKTELNLSSIFFNPLTIRNVSGTTQSVKVKLTSSEKINLIGNTGFSSILQPGDSVVLPIRVTISSEAYGGVAYVVSAEIISQKGLVLNTIYFYVSVPVNTDIRIRYLNTMAYFNKNIEKGEFNINLKNAGNITENVYLQFTPRNSLFLYENQEGPTLKNISLMPGKDTTLKISIYKKPKHFEYDRIMQAVDVEISTTDSTYYKTIWVKSINSKYINNLYSAKPLVLELASGNLLLPSMPFIRTSCYGVVQLKKDIDISYFFANYSHFKDKYFLDHTRAHIQYTDQKLTVRLGDLNRIVESYFNTKGIDANYRLNKHLFGLYAGTMFSYRATTVGGYYEYNPSLKFDIGNFNMMLTHVSTGVTLNRDHVQKLGSEIGLVRTAFSLMNTHNISGEFGLSRTKSLTDSLPTRNGYKYYVAYQGIIDKLHVNLYTRSGSPDYAGSSKGTFDLRGQAGYPVSANSQLGIFYYYYKIAPRNYLADSLLPIIVSKSETMNMTYSVFLNPRITLMVTPEIIKQASNGFYIKVSEEEYFATTFGRISVGSTFRGSSQGFSITPRIWFGYVNVTDFAPYDDMGQYNPNIQDIPAVPVVITGLSVMHKRWRLFVNYYNGPFALYQQYYYYLYGIRSSSVYIMPQYNRIFFDGVLHLNLASSYMYDSYNYHRFNITANLKAYLRKGWTFGINTNFFESMRLNKEKEEKLSYYSLYLQAELRKEFDFQQPRVKYYDINIVFFKDFNGNRTKDENESGISDIIVSFERYKSDTLFEQPLGVFSSTDILTDKYGIVSYENIPQGSYKIKFQPLTNLDEFSFADGLEQIITVGQNMTYYVPASIPYKVTGRIIFNRDPLSAYGRIDMSSVRVSATDTLGNSYYSLTESDGTFIVYIPNAGAYNISINNIFYEHFDLEKNNIEVDFNGFKQFEVIFVFNEKRRSINFNGSSGSGDGGNIPDGPIDNMNLLRDPNSVGGSSGTSGTSTTRPTNVRTFGENDTEIDTSASIEYIDKIFEGIEDDLEENDDPIYHRPEENVRPEHPVEQPEETPVAPDGSDGNEGSFNSGDGSGYEGNTGTTGDVTGTTGDDTGVISEEGNTSETGDVTEVVTGTETTPPPGEEVASDTAPADTDSGETQDTVTTDKSTTTEITETVDETGSVTEDEIPVFTNEDADATTTPAPGAIPGTTDVVVLDDDPNYVPVSKITAPGITFRVKLYRFGLPRFSPYTFEGVKGIICTENPDGDDYLYYSGSFEAYGKAKDELKKIAKLDFDQTEVQAFKDGNPISLEEAGVSKP